MTTPEAAKLYEAEHVARMAGKGYATHNPHNKPVYRLPVIYGFNNGGPHGWMSACLIAEDGTPLGGHTCSLEAYMPHDLGVIEGSRPDRHERFREYYPDGYRMEFVGNDEIPDHKGLNAALKLADSCTAATDNEIPGEERNDKTGYRGDAASPKNL